MRAERVWAWSRPAQGRAPGDVAELQVLALTQVENGRLAGEHGGGRQPGSFGALRRCGFGVFGPGSIVGGPGHPEALATIQTAASVINTFMPGIGSMVALALGGLYHGYRQLRNRKVNEALIQGVETARAVLTTTPEGQAADAQFVRWLMDHQKEAGVFSTVTQLVDELTDNPAAKVAAQEIASRVSSAASKMPGNAG